MRANCMNLEGWTQHQKCPLCKGTNSQPLYSTRDRHYGIKGEYQIVKCINCGLVYLNPMPDDSVLAQLYPETYYSYQDFSKLHQTALQKLSRAMLPGLGRTKDPEFSKPGTMLDLGCGSGQFLYQMKMKGWETFGVEISQAAAAVGQKNGLNIFAGTLHEASYSNDMFEYVRSNHSFEHIFNPHETLHEIHRILKPTGKLHIGVPNIESLNANVFGKYWWYLGAPVHTFNYSKHTLPQLLEQHGFKVTSIVFNSDYSGILGSLQIYFNRNTQRLSTEGALITSKPLVFLAYHMAKIIDLIKQGDAIEVTAQKL